MIYSLLLFVMATLNFAAIGYWILPGLLQEFKTLGREFHRVLRYYRISLSEIREQALRRRTGVLILTLCRLVLQLLKALACYLPTLILAWHLGSVSDAFVSFEVAAAALLTLFAACYFSRS